MAHVICVANQKGGIGKTTTAISVASILTKKGYRTLLIDADVQRNSTDTYRAKYENVGTLYDILLESPPADINDVIQHTEIGDIIASDPLLVEADSKLSAKGIAGFKVLREAVSNLKSYDFVLIDSGPSINMILRNILVASDSVLIPVTADRYAISGLRDLHMSILDAQEINPRLRIAGLLMVRYNKRTNLARQAKETIELEASSINTKLFHTCIRECNRVKEAQSLRTTIIQHDKNCTASKDYLDFVNEFLEEMQ